MSRFPAFSILAGGLALAGLTFASAQPESSARPTSLPAIASDTSKPPQGTSPSEAELHARAQRIIANQHRDDNEIDQYDRIERHLNRTGGPNPQVIEDKTYRVVPTGSGNLKILLKDGITPTDPAEYRRQLQSWETLLELMLKGTDTKVRTSRDKFEKRKQQRAEFVDALDEAFLAKPLGQETLDGRLCDVFQLNPNPAYHPQSLFQDALTHVTVKIWVDRETDQLARGEAHVTRDISFGAGILGKLYRGGTFTMDQTEVAPGIWLPKRYQYDFAGRKFLFSFDEHQLVEASHYRRVGPPKEALAVVQNELSTGKTMSVDP